MVLTMPICSSLFCLLNAFDSILIQCSPQLKQFNRWRTIRCIVIVPTLHTSRLAALLVALPCEDHCVTCFRSVWSTRNATPMPACCTVRLVLTYFEVYIHVQDTVHSTGANTVPTWIPGTVLYQKILASSEHSHTKILLTYWVLYCC